MGYNDELIGKWMPVLEASQCQESRRTTLARCCESTAHDIEMKQTLDFETYGCSENKFVFNSSIPILARTITHMNAFRVMDCVPLDGPIGYDNGVNANSCVEAKTIKVCEYYPINYNAISGHLSPYDINVLSNLICNRIDAILLNMLKGMLNSESHNTISRAELPSIDPNGYGVSIISSGVKEWAFRRNGEKNIANDPMQALCSSDYINSGKTELLIDNTSIGDYVILGNIGTGAVTYCPYIPVDIGVFAVDGKTRIDVRSRFGMKFDDIARHFKIYNIIDQTME